MVEPEAIPDGDYTTQQIADLSGISINTLLSWERRHGVPNPARNDRGERIYGLGDLAQIRWLQDQTARGTSIGDAVRLLNSDAATPLASADPVEDVVVAVSIDVTAAPSMSSNDPLSAREPRNRRWQRDLIAALETFDRASTSARLSRMAMEVGPAIVADEVIVPALEEMTQKVAAGKTDPAALALATRWLSARLAHWLDVLNPARLHAREVVLIVPDGGETSEILALAHAIRLAPQGWHVIDLPPGASLETIVAVARTTGAGRIDLVAVAGGDRFRPPLEARAALLRDLLPDSVTVITSDSAVALTRTPAFATQAGSDRDPASPS